MSEVSIGFDGTVAVRTKMNEQYDIIICGAGPTGVLLAAYLSRGGGVKVLPPPRDVAYLTIKGINHRENERNNNRSTVTFIRKPSLMKAEYV